MRFKNLKTGNIVSAKNADTIALMKKSDNYEEVMAKKSAGKKKSGSTDTTKE